MRQTACCLALLVALSAAPAARGADLSDPAEQASSVRLGIDPTGATSIGWTVAPGGNAALGRVATRSPQNSAFGVEPLAPLNGGNRSDVRVLAVGERGDVAVATLSSNSVGAKLQAAVRRPGQTTFPAFADVSGTGTAEDADLAVTPDGTVIAVWQQKVTSQPVIVQTATLLPGDPAFSPPVALSAPSGITSADLDIDLAVNARGDVAAAWVLPDGSGKRTLQVATRGPGETAFGPAQNVSNGLGGAFRPSVTLSATGVPTVAWTQIGHYSGEATGALQTSVRPVAGGAFDAPQTLTESGTDGDAPQIATDGTGRTTLVFEKAFPVAVGPRPARRAPTPQQVHAATRAAGDATFGASVKLSDDAGGDASEPQVVAAPGGAVAATWVSNFETVHVARRSSGAPEFAMQTLDTGGKARFPLLALGPDGDATIAWLGYDADGGIVRVGNLDTTAPIIDGLNVPETVAQDTDAAMLLGAHDRLSPISAAWDFGDGQTAAGFAVSHRYGAPGAYTVTVVVTDSVGNSTRATRTVTVAAPIGPPQITPTPAPARPALSKVSLSRKRVRAAKQGRPYAKKRRKRTGTVLRFTASTPGTLRLQLKRQGKGRRRGGALPAVKVKAGKQRLILTARRKGKRLRPGRYRLTLVLTSPAGTSRAVVRRLRIVR